MFDFENLEVYKKGKIINRDILFLLKDFSQIDQALRNQLRRAAISIVLNIAEGSGRFSKADKRNFYIISRGSVYECVAILDIILDDKIISQEIYNDLYQKFEEISKMLLGLIRSQE